MQAHRQKEKDKHTPPKMTIENANLIFVQKPFTENWCLVNYYELIINSNC